MAKTKTKPGPKLQNGQRAKLLEWLSADYDTRLILLWATECVESEGWPQITDKTIYYYRYSKRWRPEVERLQRERHDLAITTGLALKAERIKRLVRHADELEAIKWRTDEKGRLWNEKAWRETLDDIAKEMGHRRTTIDMRIVVEEARRIANELGLDPAAVLAEAERIVALREA